jgi:hypothetical protein
MEACCQRIHQHLRRLVPGRRSLPTLEAGITVGETGRGRTCRRVGAQLLTIRRSLSAPGGSQPGAARLAGLYMASGWSTHSFDPIEVRASRMLRADFTGLRS